MCKDCKCNTISSYAKLDLHKPLQTRDGIPVRFIGELEGEGVDFYPLIFAIKNEEGNEYICKRKRNGAVYNNDKPSTVDIVNVPQEKWGLIRRSGNSPIGAFEVWPNSFISEETAYKYLVSNMFMKGYGWFVFRLPDNI